MPHQLEMARAAAAVAVDHVVAIVAALVAELVPQTAAAVVRHLAVARHVVRAAATVVATRVEATIAVVLVAAQG